MLRALLVLSLGLTGMLAAVYWPISDPSLRAALFFASSILTLCGLADLVRAQRTPIAVSDAEREPASIDVTAAVGPEDAIAIHPGARAFATLTTRAGDRWRLVLPDTPVTRAHEAIGAMPCMVWLDRDTGMPVRCALDGKAVPYLLMPARI